MRAGTAAREIQLQAKQSIAFSTIATELLYGGAAGGGKSYLLRTSAIRWCVEVAGIQVYLFRRTLPDLRDNHLRGPTSFHVMLEPYITSGHVKYRAVENEFEFWNGAVLHLCYCDSEGDVEKYRGAEIHVLLMDELTHFTEYQYRFLRSRVRIAGLPVPAQYKAKLPRIEAASNPGSIGHAWVKRTFINPKPALEMWRTVPEEGGMVRQFIPAKLADNPHLTKDDPTYADRLRGLGADSLVRAMLDGDWDIIAGQAFEKLRREVHAIEPFEPPSEWMVFGSLDWGSSKPYSFGLWTVANGNALPDGRLYRRGALIRWKELYGWNGKPNEGRREEVEDVANRIKVACLGKRLAYIAADPAIWKVDGGPSHAERMLGKGVILRKSDNAREQGYLEVRQRIAGDEEGPMLFVTKNCHDGFWRTMPDLVMDEDHPEDVDCLTGDMLVSTPGGPLRIDRVATGDEVDTPIGPRRVLKSYDSGKSEICWAELSNGHRIAGTPDHKIYVIGKGLVPLSMLECHDILLGRNTWLEQRSLFIEAWYIAAMRAVATTTPVVAVSRFIAECGAMFMALYRRAITSTTKITTLMTTRSETSSAFWLGPMHSYITSIEKTSRSARENGLIRAPAAPFSERTRERCALIRRSRHLRAAIVDALSRRIILIKSTAPQSARNSRTGSSSDAKSAVLSSRQNGTGPERFGLVHIIAVGRCAEKQHVYNLTVEDAHLFYAAGVLSSNTDQEDHCYDEVRYGCMSRPWAMSPKKKEPKPDRWLSIPDDEEEESWRTA